MSAPPRKVAPPKGKSALVDAAKAAPASTTSAAPTPTAPVPARTASAGPSVGRPISRPGSASTTPTPSQSDQPSQPIARMKFKPKVPARRVVKAEPDVKPEIAASSGSGYTLARGGAPRGRGRGGSARGRAPPPVYTSLPAGPFGGPRPASTSTRKIVSGPSSRQSPGPETELYSDNDDDSIPIHQQSVIDIDQVSQMHESAPTSLYRDRKLNDKGGKAKVKVKDEKRKIKGKGKATGEPSQSEAPSVMEVDSQNSGAVNLGVKAEPISPTKISIPLDPNEGVPPPGGWREDDAMMSDDEEQDRDQSGRRVRSFAATGGIESEDDEDVNEAQMVDLSESEDEEEEDDLTADFTHVEGEDGPENKLFMFQFPNLFPKFEDTKPVDATAEDPPMTNGNAAEKGKDVKPDVKPDIKPTPAQLRAQVKKNGGIKPPEGRIGSLVVMRSGRVKMVLGDGIVMNVSPGVETTFLQQLVHLDNKSKAAVVLGEINKNYVVTPDIDRLLQELFINGGMTPGDKEWEEHKRRVRQARLEGTGLVKMEMD